MHAHKLSRFKLFFVATYLFNIYVLVFQTTDHFSRISADPGIGTVGDPQDVTCILVTTSVLDPSSVTSFWTGPNGIVTDGDRITINTTSDSNTYSTTLHFSYLSESDEGIYACNVTTDNHSVSRSANLTNFISKLSLGMYVTTKLSMFYTCLMAKSHKQFTVI